MLRDIRQLTSDQKAYAAELQHRWGSLLSYRYLGRTYASMDSGHVDNTVTLRHDMRNASGGLLLAVLGISSPEGGGWSDLEAVPNPVIHACQVLDPGHDVRRLEVVSEVLKQGRQMGFSRSRLVDADQPDRVLALTEGQGISVGMPPEGLQRMHVDPIEVIDSADLPPLWHVFGAHRRDDGHWALGTLVTELASPDAALHLGPQLVLMETAASDAAAEVTGTPNLQGLSSHVMFMAQGKVGPFRADCQPIGGVGGTVAVRVLLHDEGRDDRAITSGSYVFGAAH
ncbi:MAG TPA: hypothetical protein VGF87_10920 [Acidimicrobiales bacterium]